MVYDKRHLLSRAFEILVLSLELSVVGAFYCPIVSAPLFAQSSALPSVATMSSAPELIRDFAPSGLQSLIVPAVPFEVKIDGKELEFSFSPTGSSTFVGHAGPLLALIDWEYLSDFRVLRWKLSLKNQGEKALQNIEIIPLRISMKVNADRDHPRVRHLSGSHHYDAAYPPRAFRISEERMMTHDSAKPLSIDSEGESSAYANVPVLEFAVGPYSNLSGLYVGFEWSSRWDLGVSWARDSLIGELPPELLLTGNIGLGKISLAPGEQLSLPRIDMGFWEGNNWSVADNTMRRFVNEALAARLHGKIVTPPVSYDHWFGIYQFFDDKLMEREADRAAELGVEYFCLDAAWYPIKTDFSDGLGNWYPDPEKFPHGVEELSDHVRKLGMGFGLWQMIELARPGTKAVIEHPDLYYKGTYLRMDKVEAQQFALETLRKWIRDWHLTWIRWEFSDPQAWIYEIDPSGKLNIAYINGLYNVIDQLRGEFPDLYIEGCQGGSTRMDWGLVSRTHGTWLSDQTSNADLTRFMQTGALRFWPARYLDMAIEAKRNTGDQGADPLDLLSRMVGTMSFDGDIAQWSSSTTKLTASYVSIYKKIRPLLSEDVTFPLPQPQSDRDWDAVVYGHQGQPRLLYVFRMEGNDFVNLDIPSGRWKQLAGSSQAILKYDQDGIRTGPINTFISVSA